MKPAARVFAADKADRPHAVSVNEHLEFQRSLQPADLEDDDFDDQIQVDPYVTGTNNRRSDKELNRMLDLIDNLPISTNGTDGQA